eukprot:GGOE01043037.1.p2 GENE.GGOE01043037.1~~GGOE01043037.1.p2  ORF type:complete len:163 (-),score=45.31 GGOE01043037.1:131-619(-)
MPSVGSSARSPTSVISTPPVPSHPLQQQTGLDSAAGGSEEELERSVIHALQSSWRSSSNAGDLRTPTSPAGDTQIAMSASRQRHAALDDPHVTAAVARFVVSMQAEGRREMSVTPSSMWSSALTEGDETEELRRVSAQTRKAEDVLLNALQGLCTAVDRCLL